jgi:hypothetical protein
VHKEDDNRKEEGGTKKIIRLINQYREEYENEKGFELKFLLQKL